MIHVPSLAAVFAANPDALAHMSMWASCDGETVYLSSLSELVSPPGVTLTGRLLDGRWLYWGIQPQ